MKDLAEVVKWILMNEIEARSDDDLLGYLVETHLNPQIAELPYKEVRVNRYKYFKYSTESIRRARQKIQELYPELQSDVNRRQHRLNKIKEYKEFARTKV